MVSLAVAVAGCGTPSSSTGDAGQSDAGQSDAGIEPEHDGPDTPLPGIKFNAGHYVALLGDVRKGNAAAQLAAHSTVIAALPDEVRGVQVQFQLNALEGDTPGDYAAGIALIQEYIDICASHDKHFMLWLLAAHFGNAGPDLTFFFPAYIVNDAQYGITTPESGSDRYMRTWQPATMDRFIALSTAYAAAFDGNANFEMITFGETATRVAVGQDAYSSAAQVDQLKRYLTATRPRWPQTQQRYHANYLASDAQMADLIGHAASLAGTIGGPDTILTEDIQSNRVFTNEAGSFVDYRGVIPFVSEVQSPSLGGHEGTWTPVQLMDHMRNGATGILPVHPQYVVWLYNTFTPDAAVSGYQSYRWSTGIRPFIESISGQVTNGTSATLVPPSAVPCPSGFSNGCQ